MIPQHLIDKAAKAIRFQVDIQRHAGQPWPPEVLATAALEAVAADIWEEGMGTALDWDKAMETYFKVGGEPPGDLTNPYRASETE